MADQDRSHHGGFLGTASYTLYMDESGSVGDREGPYVLASLAGSEDAIARLTDRFYYLKRGMAPERDPDSWEIHSSRIMSGHSPIRARTERKKLAALEAIVDTICESDVTLFGASIVNELARPGEKNEAYYALTFMLERFELFLRSCSPEENGRIISDMMRRGTGRRMNHVFIITTLGHNPISHTKTERIMSMEYASSLSSPPIQLADVIAHVIRRHMEGDERFAGMFAKLMNKMWQEGDWGGWKEFSVRDRLL